MIARSIAILLAGATSALCSPYQLKEYHPVPRGWTEIGPAPGSHTIELQIGLKQHRFDELEKSLYEGQFGFRLAVPLASC
jgi:tripeptidyl-peptidase-1